MKGQYTETKFKDGVKISGPRKTVELPFGRISTRAIIIRERDLAVLGTLHRQGGKYAPPGGALEHGENTAEGVARELKEENIQLIDPDPNWRDTFTVDYFPGYQELSIWYIIPVEDAVVGDCEENIDTRWLSQSEDIWYPFLRETIILALSRLAPELTDQALAVVER